MSKLDINENMKLGIDLKTIGQIVGLVIAGATMWFTLKGDVSSLDLKLNGIFKAQVEIMARLSGNGLRDKFLRIMEKEGE